MKTVIIAAATSLVVSAVYNKISAVHTFNVIDGYVKNIIYMTKELIRNAYIGERSAKRGD